MNAQDYAKLKARARLLALRPDSELDRELEMEVVVAQLGRDSVGVPVGFLREILRMPPLTALPSLPPEFLGLVQIRGELVSVVDLGRLLGLTEARQDGSLVVVEQEGRSLGLATDAVLGVRQVFRDELTRDSDETIFGGGDLLRATTRDLLSILDPEKLLNDERIVVGASTFQSSSTPSVHHSGHSPGSNTE